MNHQSSSWWFHWGLSDLVWWNHFPILSPEPQVSIQIQVLKCYTRILAKILLFQILGKEHNFSSQVLLLHMIVEQIIPHWIIESVKGGSLYFVDIDEY